jgi:hypothetical protein
MLARMAVARQVTKRREHLNFRVSFLAIVGMD